GVQPAAGSGNTTSSSGPTSGVTSSLTVELTQCDAEFLTWFLANTTVRYTLLSFKDYSTPPTDNQDEKCKTIKDANGVSNTTVDKIFGFSKLEHNPMRLLDRVQHNQIVHLVGTTGNDA